MTDTSAPHRWEQLATSRLVVTGLVLVLAVPNLIRGPVLLADDYVWLRNAMVHGWLGAGGPRTYSRPFAMMGANLTFGLIGPHPLPLYLVQIVLWALAALAVLGLLRRVLPAHLALLVTVVWLLLPNHLSLEYWLSTSGAWSAIAACAYGLSKIIDDTRRDRVPWVGIALVTAGMLFYEVTALVAFAGVVLLPWLLTGRFQRRTAAIGVTALLLATAWSLGWNSSYPGSSTTWLPGEILLTGTLSSGLFPFGGPGRALSFALVLCVVAVAVGLLRRKRRRPRRGELMVLAGAGVICCGVAPQVHLLTSFYGTQDRSNTVTSIGLAVLLVGLALVVLRPVGDRTARRVIGVSLFAALAVLGAGIRATQGRIYHAQGVQAAAAIRRLGSPSHGRPVEVPAPFVGTQWIAGLGDGWNASAALQFRTHDPRAVVWVVAGCRASGPPTVDPLAAFGSGPLFQPRPGCAASPDPAP